MKLSDLKKTFYLALIFFGTLILLSFGYAALSGWLTTADKVSSGSGLTATSWNRIVDAILELDARTNQINATWGVLSAGKIRIIDTVTENTACTPDGLMARDGSGAILSCQTSIWKKQNNAPIYINVGSNGDGIARAGSQSRTETCPVGSYFHHIVYAFIYGYPSTTYSTAMQMVSTTSNSATFMWAPIPPDTTSIGYWRIACVAF